MVRQSFVSFVLFVSFVSYYINLLTILSTVLTGKDACSADVRKDTAQDGGISGWRRVSERNSAPSSAASRADPYTFDAVVQQGDL